MTPAGRPAVSYAERRAAGKPNGLVTQAIRMVADPRGRALDVGAGALADTRAMLLAGLRVQAVDPDPATARLAAELGHPGLTLVRDDVRNLVIEPAAYALIAAIHVLPFVPRADLPRVMAALRLGLADGGLFCGTFFGERDGWAGRRALVTFLSRGAVLDLLGPCERISFEEEEFSGIDALDRPKRWHVFRFLVRNPISPA